MRLTIIIILLAAAMVVGALAVERGWFSPAASVGPAEPGMTAGRQQTPQAKDAVAEEPAGAEESAAAVAGRQQALTRTVAAREQEIEALLRQYDANLQDPKARARLQRQINALLADYNAAVLPLATEKMAQTERAQDG